MGCVVSFPWCVLFVVVLFFVGLVCFFPLSFFLLIFRIHVHLTHSLEDDA